MPVLCLSISQQPTTLQRIAVSPASCCDFYLTDTWSAWSWMWFSIAASPLPPQTANGAGHDTSKISSSKDLSWHPFSLTSTSLTCQPSSPESMRMLMTYSSNRACWWSLAASGRASEQGHGNRRWNPPDLEAETQHYKNGVGSLPPQEQGS